MSKIPNLKEIQKFPQIPKKALDKAIQSAEIEKTRMDKIKSDIFQRRFSMTKAGYFPEIPEKTFQEKIIDVFKTFIGYFE